MNIKTYDFLSGKLRDFFKARGYIEVPTQMELSILAACENVDSIVEFNFGSQIYPMSQSGQMLLEKHLLTNPDIPGVFTFSTSYRNERNPIPGRHDLIFPMFEFEGRGGMEELLEIELELLMHLGIAAPDNVGAQLPYDRAADKCGVDTIEAGEEELLRNMYGDIIFLKWFPEHTNPFFNMQRESDGTATKVDVLLNGVETIGSAVRSNDVESMREKFMTIVNGDYALELFQRFGKERVLNELEEYLKLTMTDRFGAGIGLTRLGKEVERLNLCG